MNDRKVVASSVPRFSHGVRFAHVGGAEGGRPALLVPEGIVHLNASAAAVAACIDGRRSVGDIGALLRERFASDARELGEDVDDLLERFARNMWIEFEAPPA